MNSFAFDSSQEYCDGGTLLAAIQTNRFFDSAVKAPRLGQVLPLLAHIAAGCEYIHNKNIIHGDLKPDNVLLKTLQQVPSEGFIPPSSGTSEGAMAAKVT